MRYVYYHNTFANTVEWFFMVDDNRMILGWDVNLDDEKPFNPVSDTCKYLGGQFNSHYIQAPADDYINRVSKAWKKAEKSFNKTYNQK